MNNLSAHVTNEDAYPYGSSGTPIFPAQIRFPSISNAMTSPIPKMVNALLLFVVTEEAANPVFSSTLGAFSGEPGICSAFFAHSNVPLFLSKQYASRVSASAPEMKSLSSQITGEL